MALWFSSSEPRKLTQITSVPLFPPSIVRTIILKKKTYNLGRKGNSHHHCATRREPTLLTWDLLYHKKKEPGFSRHLILFSKKTMKTCSFIQKWLDQMICVLSRNHSNRFLSSLVTLCWGYKHTATKKRQILINIYAPLPPVRPRVDNLSSK